MVARLEIRLKKELLDAEGAGIRRKAREYFGFEVDDIRVIRVLTIDADLAPDQLAQLRTENRNIHESCHGRFLVFTHGPRF
jgi:phosphoribosylformylglycinamidine synthase subunit PurSL